MSKTLSHASIACLLGLLSTPALADGDPTTDAVPRAIPYQGIIEIDGEPVDASGADAIPIRFALYDRPDGDAPVYAQRIDVEVYRGRFTASIGPRDDAGRAIEEVVRAADGLTLGMTLLGDPDDPDDDIELANRQRLMATPYALWTTSAAHFTVAADLTVGGDVRMSGGTLDLGGGTLDLGGGTLRGVNVIEGGLQLGGGVDLGGGALSGVGAVNGGLAVDGALSAETLSAETLSAETLSAETLSVGGQIIEPRYHVVHRDKGDSVLLDQARIATLCGDGDGCDVRIAMRLWGGANDTAAASRQFLLYFDAPSRRWRTSRDAAGQIGDGRHEHAFQSFETCYLTEGRYVDFRNEGDDGLGFKLLLWNGFNGPDRECAITFID